MTQPPALTDWINDYQTQIESALSAYLVMQDENVHTSQRLLDAMRYATLNGGKRLRALLVLATGTALGCQPEQLMAPACAVEFIHAYSLVHDDMPVMDNDDLRRGKPTCHKAYDDATALLVGDALQSLAFEVLCTSPLLPAQQIQMVQALAQASGVMGMAGGQALDLEAVGRTLHVEQLQNMHELKTGALIRASVKLGALAAEDCSSQNIQQLDRYAHAIGLAFQVQDDVLDVIMDTETLGKTQGADIARHKPTYPSLLGLERAQEKARQLIDSAQDALNTLSYDTHILSELAQLIVTRKN